MITNSVDKTINVKRGPNHLHLKKRPSSQLVQNNAVLSNVSRELAEFNDHLYKNFSSADDISTEVALSLFLQQESVVSQLAEIRPISISDFAFKIEILSCLFRFDVPFDGFEFYLQSLVLDFDSVVLGLTGLCVLPNYLEQFQPIARNTAYLNGLEEFVSTWQSLHKLCDVSDFDESASREPTSFALNRYFTRLEELLLVFAVTSSATLGEVIGKRQVLEICYTAGFEFLNARQFAKSFVQDCDHLLFKRDRERPFHNNFSSPF